MAKKTSGAGRVGGLGEARELVSLVATLSEAGDSLTIEAVSSKLGVSRARAEKLIQLVLTVTAAGERGLPLVEEADGEGVTLAFSDRIRGRRLRLTKSETLAVAAALERLGISDDDPLLLRLNETLCTSEESSPLLGNLGTDENDEGVADNLEACARSSLERKSLGFLYRKVNETSEEYRHVIARGLRHEDGLWYLDAYDIDRMQDRVFRVDRMRDPELLEKVLLEPEVRKEEGKTVELVFTDPHYLQLLPWHELKELKSGSDGTTRAEIPYYGGLWLVRMIAACGGTVTTTDEELNALVDAYAKDQLSRVEEI